MCHVQLVERFIPKTGGLRKDKGVINHKLHGSARGLKITTEKKTTHESARLFGRLKSKVSFKSFTL